MEKEARFKVDKKNKYKLQHYVLKKKEKIEQEALLARMNEELGINAHTIPDAVQQISDFGNDNGMLLAVQQFLADELTPTTYQEYCECQNLQAFTRKGSFVKKSLRSCLYNLARALAIQNAKVKDFPCTCKGEEELSIMQILPVGINNKEVICYNSCLRTLFAAYKRATMQVYPPEQEELEKFGKFAKDFIDKHLLSHLLEFDYSYSQWFNKMPLKKQKDILKAKERYEEKGKEPIVKFGLFCKREKQELGGKNRAIANIDPITKFIMGPVTWALEDICDNYFPGYCGKKNWDKLEEYYMNCEQDGFVHVLQGDGSAFDLSQHASIKKYVDFYIYEQVYKHVYHVSKEDFLEVTTNPNRILDAQFIGRKTEGVHSLAKALIHGTVFSGASDTTLMNTIRMSLYNHYTLQRKGYKYDEDYRLLSKGDDFIVFTRQPTLRGIPYSDVYYEIWSKKAKDPLTTEYQPHGIGQILKFLIVGDITSIDFCSTCVIRDKDGVSLKIVRRPERMTVLDSFTRAGMKLSRGQFKQYLQDLALALEISHGKLPFYRNFIEAYRAWADKIPSAKEDARDGPERMRIDDDGHRQIMANLDNYLFQNYGHDFQYSFLSRMSSHTVSDDAVYEFLLDKYGISMSDIEYHRRMLLSDVTFNAVQQSIDENAE